MQHSSSFCSLLAIPVQDQFGGAAPPAGQQAEAALLPLLMAGYGASLSPTDRAVWSLAQAINLRLWQRARAQGGAHAMAVDGGDSSGSEEEGVGEGDAVAALLEGPLSETG